MVIDLSGKIALITGASGQLGRVIARTLAQCGADIVVHYGGNAEGAQKVLSDIKSTGRRAMAVQADITKLDSIMLMRDKVIAELGAPDIIVNNAVIQYEWASVLNQSVEDFESQFESCVMQNVLMAKAFVPEMIKKNSGRVIAINSECAMQNFATQSAYVAGKRGMDGVLRVLAREIGEHNITVNQVAPGWTISEKDRLEGTEKNAGYERTVPLKRRGTDQEVANVVAFLASDLASNITGVYLPVCGGNVMPCI